MKNIIILSAIFIQTTLMAQSMPRAEILPLGVNAESSIKAIVVEQTYPIVVHKINSPVKFDLIKSADSKINQTRPHNTLSQQYIAMKNGEYKRFLETWTKDSQIEMSQRNIKGNRTEAFWIDLWEKNLINATSLEIRNVITYSKYVLLDYSILSSDGKILASDTIAFAKEGDVWLATQALAQDPILANWNNPSGRIQIPPLSMIAK
jgi:hypothetical protein